MRPKIAVAVIALLAGTCALLICAGLLPARADAAEGVGVSGTVYLADPSAGLEIYVYREMGEPGSGNWWGVAGDTPTNPGSVYEYAFSNLESGRYKIQFRTFSSAWQLEFWNDKRTLEDADVIVYDGVTPVTDIDCTFDPVPVTISGTVDLSALTGSMQVTLYREVGDPGSGWWQEVDWLPSPWWEPPPLWDYTFYGHPAGRYKIEFRTWEQVLLDEYWDNKRTLEEADVIVYDGVTPVTGVDCTFDPAPVSISGTIPEFATDFVSVELYREMGDPGATWWEVVDAAGGPEYAFYGHPAGRYKVGFQSYDPKWLDEFWDDKRTLQDADVIVYDGVTPVTGINCTTLDPTPVTISGTVYSAHDDASVWITLLRETGDPGSGWWEQVDWYSPPVWGAPAVLEYAFYGHPAGRYRVEFKTYDPAWQSEYWNDKRTFDEADVIVYDGVTPVTGVDCTFDPAPVTISGTVQLQGADAVWVTLHREMGDPGSGSWEQVAWASTPMEPGAEFSYAFYGYPAGRYRVGFQTYSPAWLDEFWDDKRTFDEADVIVYDGVTPVMGIDCTLDPVPPEVVEIQAISATDATASSRDDVYMAVSWADIMARGLIKSAVNAIDIEFTVSQLGQSEPLFSGDTSDGTWSGVSDSDYPFPPDAWPSDKMPQRAFEAKWTYDLSDLDLGDYLVSFDFALTRPTAMIAGHPHKVEPYTFHNEFLLHITDY